jgi:hypothetical protein
MEKSQTRQPATNSSSGALAPNQAYRNSILPQDGFMVGNQQPDRVYRFVSRTYLEKSGGFDRRGWEPITASNSKGECLISPWGNHASEGTDVKNGDLVLAFMPKERVEMKRAAMAYRKGLAESALNRLRSKRNDGVDSMDVTIQRPGKSVEQLGFK